jgi:hypothetical protein
MIEVFLRGDCHARRRIGGQPTIERRAGIARRTKFIGRVRARLRFRSKEPARRSTWW